MARHAQIIQSNKFAICNILRKKGVIRLIFCIQKVFYKLILWFLMGMVKHSQSYQNSRFAMSLQYLKKDVRDEVDFLLADKHQSFLQVDLNTLSIKILNKVILSLLMGMFTHSQSTQSIKLAITLQYLTNEVSHKAFLVKNW